MLDAVEHLASEQDIPLLRQEVQALGGVNGETRGGSASSRGGRGGDSAVRLPAALTSSDEVDNYLTREWAQEYIPHAKGCTIVKETYWHKRWKAAYVCRADPDDPTHHSITYKAGNLASFVDSLVGCWQWAWDVHVQEGGDACPWDFHCMANLLRELP